MSGRKSREKGARGEREWAGQLRDLFGCDDAHRGRQYHGGPDAPDVAKGIPGTHCEVKRTEKLSLYAAIEQALIDCGTTDVPYVAHRRNNEEWLVIVRADDLAEMATRIYLHLAGQR